MLYLQLTVLVPDCSTGPDGLKVMSNATVSATSKGVTGCDMHLDSA